MVILTGVSWYVFADWICMSLIIPNVEHFSRPFFFLLKKKKKEVWVKYTFWNCLLARLPSLNFLVDFRPQDFFWGQVSFTALQSLRILSNHEQWVQSWCFGKRPLGSSISTFPNLVTRATEPSWKLGFLGCKLEWNVPGQTPKRLCMSPYFLCVLLI